MSAFKMMNTLQFVNETDSVMAEGLENGSGMYHGLKRGLDDSDSDSEGGHSRIDGTRPKPGKKTKGRVKIKMEFIENKLRRYTTFSKRKTGIMKKAYELSTLTGTQVMLLVASETGHVYTFATRKLQPMITSDSGKALIQTCLNSPDNPPVDLGRSSDDQRMNPTGFEEPELSCPVSDEEGDAAPRVDCKVGLSPFTASPVLPPEPVRPTPTQPAITPAPSAPINITPNHATSTSTPPQTTISMTTFIPQLTTGSTANNKPQSISMQLPTGGLILPSNAIPPGTPIAFSPAVNQTAQTPTQSAVYRIPTPSQVISLPGFANQSVMTTSAPSHTPQSSAPTASTVHQLAQSLPVLASGTASSAAGQSPAAGTVMYQTPQGVMYAASPQGIPEGSLIFSMPPQTPVVGIPQDQNQGGATPQYITIPVSSLSSGSTQAMYQQVIAPQTSTVDVNTATDLSKNRK